MKLLLFTILGILLLTACQKDNDDEIKNPPEETNELIIDPGSIRLAVGESCQLVAKLNGKPLKAGEVRWESNSNLISVDNRGVVKAVLHDEFISGLSITATMPNDLYAICHITVYQLYDYKFRLVLKDKGSADFSLDQPEKFLSIKAVEKRRKKNIAVDDLDLPISKKYLEQIEKIGGVIVSQSKWLKTVCVECKNEQLMDEYKKLPFVEDVIKVWRGVQKKQIQSAHSTKPCTSEKTFSKSSEKYGEAWRNIVLHNGQILHERGFKGNGIDVAVIDAGFKDLLHNPTLNNMQIKGAKSFIYEDDNPFNADEHGVWVTACMATNKPGYYIGTAPEANYWLLRSEDLSGDYPAEEDYWVSAIEYADSIGVDIVNTSLYYVKYDWPFSSYKFEEMDGKTAMPTRAANVAANKGLFIVCCAGNHGSWVGTPADSPAVLAVGSVNSEGGIGNFTAYGLTVDGRMKPDVVSLGQSACTIGIDGEIDFRSGTSYASPILCGLAACLWEAYPWLTNQELLDIFKKSANRYNAPVLPYGYGSVDVKKMIDLAESMQTKE